jgi:hypothetical protein
MFVANSHLKIMQSFAAAPQVHAAANRNPAMRGGPFIAYDPGRVNDIRSLLDETVREQARVLELAADIQRLFKLLAAEAGGASLEPLYEKVPETLRPKQVYVYAMGQEPWLTYLTSIVYTEESRPIVESNRLVAECRARGVESERLFGSKEIEL